MDQYFAEIVVVLITGAFSILSIIVQKRQDKIVSSIDKKTVFMEKERELRKRIDNLSREREDIIHNMMILILDSNLELMRALESSKDSSLHSQLYENAKSLKESFEKTTEKLEDINKEYQIVNDMAKEAQAEIERLQQMKKRK